MRERERVCLEATEKTGQIENRQKKCTQIQGADPEIEGPHLDGRVPGPKREWASPTAARTASWVQWI
ncbi:unnamed protein product [Prunus armeniaca]|uniref:Uncharacterized protein n=1 Tax=Prunus armeniaca TaxID=36596 RepID=A0A6J5WZD2_PRUAR|nr:unnamed protein product [Prunus armeniaca]